jgi:hypothetical protein
MFPFSDPFQPELMIKAFLRSIIPYRYTPSGYVDHLIRKRSGLVVQSGLFKGMKYINQASGSVFPPKLLGIYEMELHPIFEEMLQHPPERFVDIGAAEGYYAVGMALRLPASTEILAFEMDVRARRSLNQLASRNNVEDRLSIREKCEPQDLAVILRAPKKTFLLCDVEGYEKLLLDPAAVPELRNTSILVEMHDFLVPDVSELIRQRFEATHEIQVIHETKRTLDQYPYSTLVTQFLPDKYRLWAVGEHRSVPMHWFWMQPR